MRKPIISRTMTTTKVSCKCIDVESEEVFEIVQEIPRTYKDNKSLEKAVKSAVETDRVRVYKITGAEECKHLFAMTEQTFIDHATEITGRTAAETAKLFGANPDEIEVETTN